MTPESAIAEAFRLIFWAGVLEGALAIIVLLFIVLVGCIIYRNLQ